MEIAIVTGASSGLGREYAKLLDQEGLMKSGSSPGAGPSWKPWLEN